MLRLPIVEVGSVLVLLVIDLLYNADESKVNNTNHASRFIPRLRHHNTPGLIVPTEAYWDVKRGVEAYCGVGVSRRHHNQGVSMSDAFL